MHCHMHCHVIICHARHSLDRDLDFWTKVVPSVLKFSAAAKEAAAKCPNVTAVEAATTAASGVRKFSIQVVSGVTDKKELTINEQNHCILFHWIYHKCSLLILIRLNVSLF